MIREAMRRSLGVARVHPWMTFALGVALVLAIASAFAGLGLILFPWFVCELFALALAASGVGVQPRGLAWVRAGGVVLAAAVVFASVVALAALVFGPDLASVDRAHVLPWEQALLRLAGITSIAFAALAYVLPFVHVPLVLLERGGPVGAAVLESLLLLRRGGAATTFRLVVVAASFTLLPAIAGAIVTARLVDRASTPVGVLASLPLLLVSVPLGLGMVAQGYLLHRHRLPARHLVRARPLPQSTAGLLATAVVAPVGGLVLLLAACALPAPLLASAPPPSGVLVVEREVGRTFTVPGTALTLTATAERVEVAAAIEGRPTVLDTPASRTAERPIARVRVLAFADLFAVALVDETGRTEGWALIDGSGARLDDTVHRALDERMGVARALVFGPGFLVIALALLFGLGPLAETRGDVRPSNLAIRRAEARARATAWALVPCWGAILVLGALAAAGR
ncbi:MAG: hypothetical protein OHK0013_24240 [Sandaracinaceae bacterium]